MDGEYCYHITGQPGKDKYLKVTTNLGSAKNSFVLSGWIKTDSTPVRKGRELKVTAYHREETDDAIITLKTSNDINVFSEGWKYFCMIIPAASWKGTTFTISFYDNIGDLYIDGLQLTRNDVQTKKYDSAGRVTSSYTAQKSTSYGYDGYNRMNKQTAASGATTTYSYAGNNEVTKIAASIGPDVYMKYDKYGNRISSTSYDPEAATRLELYSETAYTEDGNFEKSSTDNAGNVTSYEYNTLTGQLEKTILPARRGEESVETDYIYDSEDRISEVSQSGRRVTYEYGEFDDLTGITHNGFSYNYTYDGFGNVLSASIAGTTICTNEYAPYNGSHVRSVFADGTSTGTTYDEYGKITSNSLDGITISKYIYDNDGNVARKTDALADVTTKYDYNDSNMLVRSEVYDGESTASEDLESRMQYTYTKSGKVGTLSYQEKDSDIKTYTYTYAADDKPVKSILPDKSYTTWSYDSLRRNTKIIHVPKNGAVDSKRLYTTLQYQPKEFVVDGKMKKATTGLVSRYTNKFGNTGKTVSDFSYYYDTWGNITSIIEIPEGTSANEIYLHPEYIFVPEKRVLEDDKCYTNNDSSIGEITSDSVTPSGYAWKSWQSGLRTYTYNDYGEVTWAREFYKGGDPVTYAYTYDEGGNILTETIDNVEHTYVYDSVWKDKLISYDGKVITYDV